MQVDLDARTVSLSVSALAGFSLGPDGQGEGTTGLWRAHLGTQWHRTLRARREAEAGTTGQGTDALRFEQMIEGTLRHNGWIIHLQGRIDQVEVSEDRVLLREVKSVSSDLPLPDADLWHRFPDYVAQVALYARLAGNHPDWADRPINPTLLFVDIRTGLVQETELTDEPFLEEASRRQLDRLTPFLDSRLEARRRRTNLHYHPAFTDLRPGQAETVRTLRKQAERFPALVLDAPTGFGKTGLALDWALEHLRDGRAERLIYLTGKSTGQRQVVDTLRGMMPLAGNALRTAHVRSRQEHIAACPNAFCRNGDGCRHEGVDRWRQADLSPEAAFTPAGEIHLAASLARAVDTQACPYALTRCGLAFADVWVGDYNYVFHPGSMGVFAEQPGFDSSRTLLVIDEAHNLPERVAAGLSSQLDAGRFRQALGRLDLVGLPRRLAGALDAFADWLERLRPCDELPVADSYVFADLAEAWQNALRESPPDWDALPPDDRELLWTAGPVGAFLREETWSRLTWVPRPGVLALTCLQAPDWIAGILRQFRQVLLMTATPGPAEAFCAGIGLEPRTVGFVPAEAAWREAAYAVAADLRIDTRLRYRASGYAGLAETLVRCAEADPDPAVVFFSSFKYSEAVATYCEAAAPWLRIARQPRGRPLAEQEAFLEEALLTADLLFLVLGSGFAEGIDRLGGRVRTAIVVGPALPEINPPRERLRTDLEARHGRAEAFRRAYTIPGLQKVEQALGRLVRSPDQRARVLLVGRRYGEPETGDLLHPVFVPETRIRREDDLTAWLRETGAGSQE
ncbi:MAG: ATP-dependent DNA helicase [Opitutales bacterium]